MPVPFIIGGIAVAAGLKGVEKTIHAAAQNKDAKNINQRAENLYESSKHTLNAARKASHFALEGLGEAKLTILTQSVNPFIDVFSKIHNVELTESVGLEEMKQFKLDKQAFEDMKQLGSVAVSLIGGLVGGSMAGSLAAFGAYGATMTFAAASTGTAIASLSGIAATNATLAFLGGGSLAAGGLGMAGGTMVLGGLVAGPALAVLGFFLDAKASKNLDTARSNMAEARKISEEFQLATELCNGISDRAKMFFDLLVELDGIFKPLISKLEFLVELNGCDYAEYSPAAQKVVAMSVATAAAIKKVLDTPILTTEGHLTENSLLISGEIRNLINTLK